MTTKETRVTETGQTFEAAPNKAGPRGPVKLKGSHPRLWETRRAGECAAIVHTDNEGHYACCLPVWQGQKDSGKYPYCEGHWPFMQPTVSSKELTRSLRRYT